MPANGDRKEKSKNENTYFDGNNWSGAILVTSHTQAHDSRWLGDGRISSGPWLKGDRYHPHDKIHVNGQVDWPNARINIIAEKGMRIVQANNILTHSTGEYPIRQSDPAYQYDRNPNSIREQIILMRLPLMPKFAQSRKLRAYGFGRFHVGGWSALQCC